MSAQRRPSDVDDEFLTVVEVAAVLQLKQQTIRNWIDQMPFFMTGVFSAANSSSVTPRWG